MKCYKIRDWESLYETHETRKLKKMLWLSLPNNHDSLGFRKITMQKNCCEIFTVWILMLQMASRCNPRGTLNRENLPLSPDDMGIITGIPADYFKNSIPFLISIGWVEEIEISGKSPATSGDISGKPPDTGMECMEGMERTNKDKKDGEAPQTVVINTKIEEMKKNYPWNKK